MLYLGNISLNYAKDFYLSVIPSKKLGSIPHAFIAQGLERWSSKPEAGRSILTEGIRLINIFLLYIICLKNIELVQKQMPIHGTDNDN